MADDTFTWGSGGEKLSSADRRRRIAEAMMKAGSDTSPVQHWTQGLNRVAQAMLGAWESNKLDAEEKAGRDEQGQRNAVLIGGATTGGATTAGATASAPAETASLGTPNDVENSFVDGVKSAGLTNPFGLGAVAAYGNAESKYAPGNVNRTWSDPSESGTDGTSGGIMSWRDDRLRNLQRFAAQRGEQGNGSPATQAAFLAQEDSTLIPRLNGVKSPEEANQIMASAWRFAGHDRPGGEFARRLSLTQQYAQRFGGQQQATAADLPAPGAKPVEADTGTLGFFVPPAPAPEQGFLGERGALPNFDPVTGRWQGPSNPPALAGAGSPDDAVKTARSYLGADALTLTDVAKAFRAKTGIDQMIADATGRGQSGVVEELTPIRDALDDKLAASAPQYAAARGAYRSGGQPQQEQPLAPVFTAEGVSQPWMSSAIMPAPPQPQIAQAQPRPVPMPPPRPADLAMPQADLPAPGAVQAMGQIPVQSPSQPQPLAVADPTTDNAGALAGLVASEEARRGLPSGAGIMSPIDGLRQAFGGNSTPAGNGPSIFDRIVSAVQGSRQDTAQPAPSAGVQRVAAAKAAVAPVADAPAAPSDAVQRVAAASNATAPAAATAAPQAANARLQAAQATLNSRYATASEKAVAQSIIMQSIKGGEFETITRPDGSVYHVPKTGNGAPVQVFGPQTKPEGPTGDMREYALYTDQAKAAGQQPESFTDWSRGNKAAGRTQISIDTKGAGKFAEKANEYQAKRYSDMASAADESVVLRSDVETLSGLLSGIQTGRGAETKLSLAQMAKGVGLDTVADALTGGKMNEMEAAQSIMDKLTPRMRVPGSGATSDMEMRVFRNALPSLLKQPGGNAIVADTYRGMLDYQAQVGDIAGRALRGEISQAEADKAIRETPSPFTRFKDYQKAQQQGGGAGNAAGQSSSATSGSVSGQTKSGLKWSVQ